MKELNDITKMPTIVDKDGRDYTLRLYVTTLKNLAVSYGDIYNQINICAFIVDKTRSKEYYIKKGRMDKTEVECYIEGVNTIEEAFNRCYEFIHDEKNSFTIKNYKTPRVK